MLYTTSGHCDFARAGLMWFCVLKFFKSQAVLNKLETGKGLLAEPLVQGITVIQS